MQIKANSVDITSQVNFPSLVVNQNLSSTVDTASFTIKGYGNKTYTPNIEDVIEIFDGATKIFGGNISTIKTKTETTNNNLLIDIVCSDYTADVDSMLVARTYTNQSVEEIIEDIVADFTNVGSGFTTNNVNCDFIISKIIFNQIPVTQCLRRLADIVKYDWYIDSDKDIHFFSKYSEMSPFNMVEGNYITRSYEKTKDGTQIVNRVKVRGGTYDGLLYTDYITVVGSDTSSFTLPYKFSNLAIKVNSVAKTVGIDFIDTFDDFDVLYNFQDKSFRFENPLSDADLIEYSGNPKVPVMAVVDDTESILLLGKIKEKIIKDTSISDNVTARKRASAELLTYVDGVIDARFDTYKAGLRAGQVITSPEGEDLIIKAVNFYSYTPNDFKYSVSLISTKKYELIDILRKIIAPENETVDENEVSEQIYIYRDEVTIQESITKVDPKFFEEQIEIEDEAFNDAVAVGDLEWVYALYIPSSVTDVKRKGRYDRGAKYM